MFYFVYVLHSKKDNKLYIGFTKDVEKRLAKHNSGEVPSTRDRRPLELIFYEAFLNKQDVLKREKYFKTTKGKAAVRKMLSNFYLREEL